MASDENKGMEATPEVAQRKLTREERALEKIGWPKCVNCEGFMDEGECAVRVTGTITEEGQFKVNMQARHATC